MINRRINIYRILIIRMYKMCTYLNSNHAKLLFLRKNFGSCQNENAEKFEKPST